MCPQFFSKHHLSAITRKLWNGFYMALYTPTQETPRGQILNFFNSNAEGGCPQIFFFFSLLRVRSTKLVKESSNVKKITSMKKWKCQARKKQRQFALFPHFASLHLKSGSRAQCRLVVLCWQSCPGHPIPTVPLWLSCPLSNVLTVLFCLFWSARPILAFSFWLSHSSCPILAVRFWLSHLAVPFWLSRSGCPVLAVYRLSCTSGLFLTVISFCPLLAVLSSHSCAGSLFWQPCPVSPVWAVLPWKSYHGSHFLPVSPGCSFQAVLF